MTAAQILFIRLMILDSVPLSIDASPDSLVDGTQKQRILSLFRRKYV